MTNPNAAEEHDSNIDGQYLPKFRFTCHPSKYEDPQELARWVMHYWNFEPRYRREWTDPLHALRSVLQRVLESPWAAWPGSLRNYVVRVFDEGIKAPLLAVSERPSLRLAAREERFRLAMALAESPCSSDPKRKGLQELRATSDGILLPEGSPQLDQSLVALALYLLLNLNHEEDQVLAGLECICKPSMSPSESEETEDVFAFQRLTIQTPETAYNVARTVAEKQSERFTAPYLSLLRDAVRGAPFDSDRVWPALDIVLHSSQAVKASTFPSEEHESTEYTFHENATGAMCLNGIPLKDRNDRRIKGGECARLIRSAIDENVITLTRRANLSRVRDALKHAKVDLELCAVENGIYRFSLPARYLRERNSKT